MKTYCDKNRRNAVQCRFSLSLSMRAWHALNFFFFFLHFNFEFIAHTRACIQTHHTPRESNRTERGKQLTHTSKLYSIRLISAAPSNQINNNTEKKITHMKRWNKKILNITTLWRVTVHKRLKSKWNETKRNKQNYCQIAVIGLLKGLKLNAKFEFQCDWNGDYWSTSRTNQQMAKESDEEKHKHRADCKFWFFFRLRSDQALNSQNIESFCNCWNAKYTAHLDTYQTAIN